MNETTFPTGMAVDDPVVPSAASPDAGPVQPRERMVLVDVLRGFALLGILLVNWQNTTATLHEVIDFLAEGTFYTMFSFLFGLGFAIQLIRAEEAKRPFIMRYLWRTLLLFAIGAAHFVFIWRGDIVRIYAIAAVLLLVVRRLPPSLVLGLAAVLLVLSLPPAQIPDGTGLFTRTNLEQVEAERIGAQLNMSREMANRPAWCADIIKDPWGGDVCSRALEIHKLITHDVATVQWWMAVAHRPGVLCMFLLGLYAGRRRIFSDALKHTRFFIWVMAVGLVLGVVGNAFATYRDFFTASGIVLPKVVVDWRLDYSLGNIGLAFFYLSGLTLLFTHRVRARRIFGPLAYVGRMGLTNYLMQSLVFMTVLGFRDGLWSWFQDWYSLLLMTAFFAMQILYSYWWFRYFQFGPVEWLWRSLTWFRLQPFLVVKPAEQAPPLK